MYTWIRPGNRRKVGATKNDRQMLTNKFCNIHTVEIEWLRSSLWLSEEMSQLVKYKTLLASSYEELYVRQLKCWWRRRPPSPCWLKAIDFIWKKGKDLVCLSWLLPSTHRTYVNALNTKTSASWFVMFTRTKKKKKKKKKDFVIIFLFASLCFCWTRCCMREIACAWNDSAKLKSYLTSFLKSVVVVVDCVNAIISQPAKKKGSCEWVRGCLSLSLCTTIYFSFFPPISIYLLFFHFIVWELSILRSWAISSIEAKPGSARSLADLVVG